MGIYIEIIDNKVVAIRGDSEILGDDGTCERRNLDGVASCRSRIFVAQNT